MSCRRDAPPCRRSMANNLLARSAIAAYPRCSGKTGTWRNAARSSTSHPAKSCPVSFRETRMMATSWSTDGTSSFLLMKLKAFPAEPVKSSITCRSVLPLCLTVNLGMGIHAGVPKKDVTSSSVRKGPTHTCGFAAALDLLNDSLPQRPGPERQVLSHRRKGGLVGRRVDTSGHFFIVSNHKVFLRCCSSLEFGRERFGACQKSLYSFVFFLS